MVRPSLLMAVILGVVLAGCTEAPPVVEDDGPWLPLLAQYEGCPWSYPDNSSHDCESTSVVLEPQDEPPAGWICTAEDRERGWSLHWNPIDDVHGLRYVAPENATGHTGVMFLRTDFQEHFYQWEDAPASGFLQIPETFGDNVTFRYGLHDFGYATNGTLNGAQGQPVWSLFETQFWVVHKFETDNATYSFQNMTIKTFRVDSENGDQRNESYYEIDPFDVLGEDFGLWVHHERSHRASSLGLVNEVRIIDRFCQTGLGS